MKAKHFTIKELVCPHVYQKYGERAWMFLDSRLILNLDTIRERLNRPITVNTGSLTQRGFRCPKCKIVRDKFEAGELYLSAHTMGKAVDFTVKDMDAEVVRLWLAKNGKFLPYPIRVESGVSWVHMDVFETDTEQHVYFFRSTKPPVKVNLISAVLNGIKLYKLIKKLIRQLRRKGNVQRMVQKETNGTDKRLQG